MMYKNLIFLILFFLSMHTKAQQKMSIFSLVNRSNMPAYHTSMPSWANFFYQQEADTSTVNVYQLDDLVSRWFTESTDNQVKDSKENKENKWFVFYNQWRRTLPTFWIDDKGNVTPTTQDFYYQKLKETETTFKSMLKTQKAAASTWEVVAPFVTYRQNTSNQQIPFQTNIYFVDVAPSNTNIAILSTETGAMFKTTDKALNWSYIGNYQGPVAFHPSNVNYLIMGSNPFRYSTNGGESWTNLTNGTNANDIFLAPNGSFALAAGDNGLWRSDNGGQSWTLAVAGNFDDVQLMPGSSTIAYAINRSGVLYKTVNAGINWTTTSPTYASTGNGYLLGATIVNTNVIYIAALQAATGGEQSQILKSIDAGASFTQSGILPAMFSQGFYDYVFDVSPINENTIFCGITSLYKSTNAGATWGAIGGYQGTLGNWGGNAVLHPDLQDMALFGNEILIASDGGITYSPDGLTNLSLSKSRCNGIWAADFWGFAHGFQRDFFGGGLYHNGNLVYKSSYGLGNTLYSGGAESPTGVSILAYPNDAMAFNDMYSGSFLNLPTSITSGVTPISNGNFTGHPTDDYYGNRIADVVTHPLYAGTVYSSQNNSVIVSIDKGKNFVRLRNFGSRVWDIKICRANPNVLYVLTENTGLWKTADGGVTWNEINLTLNGTNYKPYCRYGYITNSQTSENTLWFAYQTNGIVFKTIDGGITWQSQTTSSINNLQISEIEHQAGTTDGVYLFGDVNGTPRCFYRNNNHTDWQNFSNNAQAIKLDPGWVKIAMAYMIGKIRVAKRGVFQVDFYENYLSPIAQPNALGPVACINTNFQLYDNSILKTNGGATWQWSFVPNTVTFVSGSSANSQNPIVRFNSTGNYAATLTVTDASSGLSHTKTVNNLVQVISSSTGSTALNITSVTPGIINTYTAKNIIFSANVPANTTVNLTGEKIDIKPTVITLGTINACYGVVNTCTY